jgi:hypothetical protein
LETTLKNVCYTKLLRDLVEIARFVLVVLRGTARDDSQPSDASKPGNDLVLDAFS